MVNQYNRVRFNCRSLRTISNVCTQWAIIAKQGVTDTMSDPAKYGPMTIAKIIGVLLFILLVIIVILQNTENIETKLLFVTMNMPRALLLFINLVIGYLLGLGTMIVLRQRTEKPPKKGTR